MKIGWGNLRDIPEVEGIYGIFANGEVKYIGQSLRMRSRLKSHRTQFGSFTDEIRFIELRGEGRRWSAERWLINKHRPPLNKRIDPMGRMDVANTLWYEENKPWLKLRGTIQ